MSVFPLMVCFRNDFVAQVVAVEAESTMDQVAAAAAVHSVGRRVRDQAPKILRVRRQGDDAPFPRDLKVQASGLIPGDTVEVYFE